jgi:mannose/cellobiose epimerase-like protein (N-acyl-D-glucosamine 2-epimerase family)
MTLMGEVTSVSLEKLCFLVLLASGDEVEVDVGKTTYYEVLKNLADDNRDRVPSPDQMMVVEMIGSREDAEDPATWDAQYHLYKYLKQGMMLCVSGVYSQNGQDMKFSARRIVLMHSRANDYGWEDNHWWIQQINGLFEQWLDSLFDSKREIDENDFAQHYRSYLGLAGNPGDNSSQECATLSRFLYGLSSSYLLTGNGRALSAARACTKYLVNAYSILSHDREYCFWKFSRIKEGNTTKEIFASLNADDLGTYALYEQIYALSGLAQYYRVTQDPWVLSYIVRTIAAFEKFYLDEYREGDDCFTGAGGYFSHIDTVTMRPDVEALVRGDYNNREKKNWNSIGDHIPAYLINLLVSIDPLPKSDHSNSWEELRTLCRKILDDCVDNIIRHFPADDGSRFVNERFSKDWQPDHAWGWQKDRGIVGHNLKISWNLTRCGHYYTHRAAEADKVGDLNTQRRYSSRARDCYDVAKQIGKNMEEVGADLVRGGIFDALERHPKNDMPSQFAWDPTKDFWQQEQAILAFYIMHGIGDQETSDGRMLQLARHCAAFWNLFFLNHDQRRIFFRTTESGAPVIEGERGSQAGHAIAGYHAFELNYLANLYIHTYVKGDSFSLTYCPVHNSSVKTLNVMPDFFRPKDLIIINIKVNGLVLDIPDKTTFQIDISSFPEEAVIEVEYLPLRNDAASESEIKDNRLKISQIGMSS